MLWECPVDSVMTTHEEGLRNDGRGGVAGLNFVQSQKARNGVMSFGASWAIAKSRHKVTK